MALLIIGSVMAVVSGIVCYVSLNRNWELPCIITAVTSSLGIGMIVSAILDKWIY